jgi:NADH:ubiquinone oxidoreductase subunit K
MAANPRSAAFFVVTLLATLVAVGLFITLMIRKQSSHRDIVMNGLAFLAVALIVVAANQYFSTKDILLS